MAKGRELKRRIKTVENTRKITRTMELVATSRMKRAQDRVTAARPYARALGDVIAGLYSPDLADRFPLLRQPERARKAAVILLTSNRGLWSDPQALPPLFSVSSSPRACSWPSMRGAPNSSRRPRSP